MSTASNGSTARGERDLAIAVDGSFVETTNRKAAEALAALRGEGNEEYAVQSRVEDGKTIYRVRPRSVPRPASPSLGAPNPSAAASSPTSPPSSTASLGQLPFARGSTQPPPPIPPKSTDRSGQPSIAVLRSSISSDQPSDHPPSRTAGTSDQSYLSPSPPAPETSSGGIRRAGSSPSLSAIASTSSVSLSRSKSTSAGASGSAQGDILGRLLGWNAPSAVGSSRREEGTAQLGLPSMFKGEGGDAEVLEEGIKGGEEERDSSDLPQDPVVEELDRSRVTYPARPTPSRTNSSPFGAGVRVPTPARSRDPSAEGAPPQPQLESTEPPRTMREVASSDSIRTAKAGDDQRPPPLPCAPTSRWDDTAVFDVMQGLFTNSTPQEVEEDPTSAYNERHARLPSSSSVSSNLSHSSSSNSHASSAHHITVSATTLAGDDPRFVIWGLRAPPVAPLSPTSSVVEARRGSIVEEVMGSPGTSASGSPATASSKRWSGFKERRGTAESGSPASSVRDSTGSIGGFAQQQQQQPQQRVLMAATAERWIVELTSQISSDLLSIFFLTYRAFLSPLHLLHLLIARFEWAMQPPCSPADEASRRIVRVRTFVVLRHWLLNHFMDDFFPSREVRKGLTEWLNRSARAPHIRQSPKDARLIKGLKKVCRRLKEMHVVLGPGDASEARRAMEEVGMEGAPKSVAAAGHSDEDIDLDLDVHEDGTATAGHNTLTPPPSAATHERGRISSFLHHHTKSAPDLASTSAAARAHPTLVYDTTSTTSATTHYPLPTPHGAQNGPLARSLHTAMGKFGRFKRMLGNRTGIVEGGSTESMDEVEFEKHETGDLLWVKGGVDRYLEFHGIRREGEGEEDVGEEGERRVPSVDEREVGGAASAPREPSYVHPIAEEPESPIVPSTNPDLGLGTLQPADEDVKPSHAPPPPASAPVIPIFEQSTYGFPDSQPQHHGYGAPSNTFFLSSSHRPASTRIELDDIDLSDEDEDVVEVKRTLKRLPGAGNLRVISTLKHLRRDSLESTSSYGEVRPMSYGGPERESVLLSSSSSLSQDPSFVDDEEGVEPHAGVQIVAGFILEGIDDSEDEDDGGGIEAALRRLEGIVDDTREKERKRKVERQMERSAKVLGMQQAGTLPQQQEAEREQEQNAESFTTTESSQASLATPPSDAAPREAAIVPPVSLIPAETAPSSPPRPTSKLPPLSISRPTGPNRKPSLSKLFGGGGGSAALRPTSARPPLTFGATPHPSAGPAPPTHRSFLLLCRTESLARQFCLIERDMLRVLGWQELVSGAWRDRTQAGATGEVLDWEQYLKERRKVELKAREKGERMESAVQAVIARFNLTANWVCSEIVLTANPEERVALVAKFIRLAFKCYCQSNFQTLTQIIHGLQLPDVERLKKTWARLPTWEMRKFRGMQVFVSHLKNFKHLREVTNALITEYGPPGQRGLSTAFSEPNKNSSAAKGVKASPAPVGCLPFLGLLLRDLTLNAELPTYLDPTSTNSPASVDSTGSLTRLADPTAFDHLPPLPSHMPLRPLINVHKFRVQATLVQRVLAFQEFAEGYPYEPETSVYFKCLKIRSLESGVMREVSMRLE